LADRLGARVGLGHDSVGLGLTERPEDDENLTPYQSSSSAEIGRQLLSEQLSKQTSSTLTPPTAVALMGHSMGSIATLRMALELPREVRTFVVLVAPALGLIKGNSVQPRKAIKETSNAFERAVRRINTFFRRSLFNPIFVYILRRAVGYVQYTGIQTRFVPTR
jgi:pimeloyl-ACP methyl ester carboxylesterase